MKTAKELLFEAFPNTLEIEIMHEKIIEVMEGYRMQGRYFTENEIISIQSAAYDAGFDAGLQEGGCN